METPQIHPITDPNILFGEPKNPEVRDLHAAYDHIMTGDTDSSTAAIEALSPRAAGYLEGITASLAERAVVAITPADSEDPGKPVTYIDRGDYRWYEEPRPSSFAGGPTVFAGDETIAPLDAHIKAVGDAFEARTKSLDPTTYPDDWRTNEDLKPLVDNGIGLESPLTSFFGEAGQARQHYETLEEQSV